MSEALAYLSASAALERFRRRELSPVELMRALLERAERAVASINATTAIHAEQALERAELAEARYRQGNARALEGVPVAIKDETAVAGWRRTIGSWLHDEVPTENHPLVDRLLAAGAIPHLQTSVPEYCVLGQTWSARFGVTRNPWNSAVTVGGSSGGSGAALAAGLAPLASGSDMAGSIRIPAAQCGLYGYKPPFGRLASTPGEELFSFAVEGPMARTLEDLIRMQNVIAGPHPASYTGMPFEPSPERYPGLDGRRLAYAFTTGCRRLCPEIRANLERALAAFEAQGAVLLPVELDWDNGEIGAVLLEAIFGMHFNEYLEEVGETELVRASSYLRWLIARHRGRPNSILKAAALATRLHRELQTKVWDRGCQALICPTLFTTAVPAELDPSRTPTVDIDGLAVDSLLGWVGTPPFNLLSRYPALAVPTGLTAAGVPTSLQIVGPPFDDAAVFAVAWHHAARGSELYTSRFPQNPA